MEGEPKAKKAKRSAIVESEDEGTGIAEAETSSPKKETSKKATRTLPKRSAKGKEKAVVEEEEVEEDLEDMAMKREVEMIDAWIRILRKMRDALLK